MAGQGCPNEGTDTRAFGVWGCKVQTALSFHSTTEPLSLLLCFPPFIAINIPLPHGRYFVLRAGFRYDKHWADAKGVQGGYIFPEAAAKTKDVPIFY